jgi:hypothetical protein
MAHQQKFSKLQPGEQELPIPKKEKTPLAKKSSFIWTTFFISVIGVSGSIITVVDFFNRKPTFEFDPTAVLVEGITDTIGGIHKVVKSNFLLVGTISNKGTDPLLPNGWSLDFVTVSGDTVKATRTFAPPRIAIDFPERKDSIIFENADLHDFERVKQVHSTEPIFGHIIFIIDLLPEEFAGMRNSVTCVLRCYDVWKKEYVVQFKCPRQNDLDENSNYPKNDLYIKPYKSR